MNKMGCLFAFLSTIFFWSCRKDPDLRQYTLADIEYINIADTTQAAVVTHFMIYFHKPSPCSEVVELLIDDRIDTIDYQVQLLNPLGACPVTSTRDSLLTHFHRDSPGIYTVRFFRQDEEPLVHEIFVR
ncbi:MAG: hypothetical protein ACK4ND_06750 [Cytophagaceae bacterium]